MYVDKLRRVQQFIPCTVPRKREFSKEFYIWIYLMQSEILHIKWTFTANEHWLMNYLYRLVNVSNRMKDFIFSIKSWNAATNNVDMKDEKTHQNYHAHFIYQITLENQSFHNFFNTYSCKNANFVFFKCSLYLHYTRKTRSKWSLLLYLN